MNYKQELYEKIKDPEKWPCFSRPNFLDELNHFADNAFLKNTTEGYLAALLVYHQICEEMIKLLVECSDLYIQCAVFPSEIKRVRRDKMVFGQLLIELKNGLMDAETEKFMQYCKSLNELRIRMVHKLTLKESLNDVRKQTKQAKKLFDKAFSAHESIYDNYRVSFSDFKDSSEEWVVESNP